MSTAERSAGRWSDLPDELVGTVRSRIASPRDRVRFLAVCKSWRAAASWQPALPAAPVLLLSLWAGWGKKHLCSPDGSWVFRIPREADNKPFLGSHEGGWVVVSDFHVLTVVNLFSGVEVALSPKQSRLALFMDNTQKIIFSQHPTSSNGCILAAIVNNWSHIALCRVGCPDGEWTTYSRHEWTTYGRRGDQVIIDIAFCNGELYGLMGSESEVLVKFDIKAKKDGTPVITTTHQLIQRPSRIKNCLPYARYIFELHGKPSMAVMSRWVPNCEPFFRVFKLVDDGADKVSQYKWAEVTIFDDYALFLGPQWSKAVHMSMGAGHHSMEKNHIYYSTTYSAENKSSGDEVYSVTSNNGSTYIEMCCKKDQSIEDGVHRIGYYVSARNSAMWLLPPDL